MKTGFTLIELLVVVLIIGILAAVALPQYQKAVLKARLVEMRTIFHAYSQSIDLWEMESGEWTSGQRVYFTGTSKNAELDVDLPNVTAVDDDIDQYRNIFISAFVAASAHVNTVYLFGADKKWLNGCGVAFGQFRNYGDVNWRFLGTVKTAEEGVPEASISSTVPTGCEDLAKILCEEWGPTGLLNSAGASQCGVTRKPYPNGV